MTAPLPTLADDLLEKLADAVEQVQECACGCTPGERRKAMAKVLAGFPGQRALRGKGTPAGHVVDRLDGMMHNHPKVQYLRLTRAEAQDLVDHFAGVVLA